MTHPGLFQAAAPGPGARAVECVSGHGAAALPTLLGSPKALDTELVEKKPVQDWKIEVSRYERLYVLREWIQVEFGFNLKPCAHKAEAYRKGDEYQLRPWTCGERDVCPRCAIKYGLEKGDELLSFFEAVLEPGELLEHQPTVKAFAFVLTLPDWLSEHLDTLVGRRHLEKLREALSGLTKAVQRCLAEWFGCDVGLKINWHWWHSSDPLSGEAHWHAHVLVPNLRFLADGRADIIQAMGKVPEAALDALRSLWAQKVAALKFVKSIPRAVPDALTVDYRFLTNWTGRHSVAHRCRYDSRHPLQDMEKWVGETEDKNGLPEMGDGVRWFFSRLHVLQSVQLVRSLGWCSNAKAKQLGLERYRPPDEWEKLTGLVYTFLRFDDGGAHVQVCHLLTGENHREFWSRDEVNLSPSGSPLRYRWSSPAPPGAG